MSTCTLIAGCGDLGLRVARRLLDAGDEVHGLRRRAVAGGPPGLIWWCADLTGARPDTLPAVDRLVFAAAPDARDEPAYRQVFVRGLQNLLAALDRSRLQRVVFVSSTAVYGPASVGVVDETTPAQPPGFNGRVLLEAEALLGSGRFTGTALRLAGLYGPGRLQLVDHIRAGTATVSRKNEHIANRIHVDDAASAIVHILGLPTPAPIYVGVDDHPLPLHELYDAIARALLVPAPADGPAPAGVGSKRLSNRLLRATGWQPQWPDARRGYEALLSR
jgi:nucleoside-diphosphate-sugar epimerase